MPIAVSGSGVEIVDAEGRRYLDASGGAAVSCLGHGHPDVLAAMRRQLDTIAYAPYGIPSVGSSRVDLQACKLEYSIVSPK